MTELHTLLIEDLPIVDPPTPIQSLGTRTILNYLHFKSISSQSLNYMRVVVVGPNKVGKTSLLNQLRGEGHDDVMPTKGLEVSRVLDCIM